MRIDTVKQKELLEALIANCTFTGKAIDEVYALKQAIADADIGTSSDEGVEALSSEGT